MVRRNPMRWVAAFAVCELIAYCVIWLVLHVPGVVPAVSNGWFGLEGYEATFYVPQSVVRWLVAQPDLTGTMLLTGFAVACVAYSGAVMVAYRTGAPLATVRLLALTVLLSIPLLALPQLFSSDVFSYAIYGRIPLVYGGNPYVDLPSDFPGDPLLPFVAWKTTVAVYGPAWILASLPVTWLAEILGGTAGIYALLYRLLGLGCHLGSSLLVARLLARLRPEAVGWGTLAFSWHPLMLIEFVGSGHNDSLMLLLVLLGLSTAVDERRSLTLCLFVAAGLVKLVAMLLVPLYLSHLIWQARAGRRWQAAIRPAVAGLTLTIAFYLPLWEGPAVLSGLATTPPLTILHQGPASWVHTKLTGLVCTRTSQPDRRPEICAARTAEGVRRASLVTFALVYLTLLCWPIRTFDAFVARSVGALIVYCVLAAVHFEPWYGTWVVGLAPLLRRPRPLLLAWGASLLLLYGTMPIKGRIMLAFAPLLMQALSESVRMMRSSRSRSAAHRPSSHIMPDGN